MRWRAHLTIGGHMDIDMPGVTAWREVAQVIVSAKEQRSGWLSDSHGGMVNLAHVVRIAPAPAEGSGQGESAEEDSPDWENGDNDPEDGPVITPAAGDMLGRFSAALASGLLNLRPNGGRFPPLPLPRTSTERIWPLPDDSAPEPGS